MPFSTSTRPTSRIAAAGWVALLVGCSHSEQSPEATSPVPRPPASVADSKAAPEPPEAAPETAETSASRAAPAPEPAPAPSGPRVYAKSRFVWIRELPNAELQWIGFLWTGGSVALRSDKVFYGPGCETWYAIEPRGFVCVDGKRATLDANDPALRALAPYAPALDTAWPHQYGESRGLPRYTQLPKQGDAPTVLKPASATTEAPSFAVARRLDRDPFGLVTLPQTVYEGRARLLPQSTVAFSAELARDDGSYLLAADMTWVPKHLVKPYEQVTFQGVELGKGLQLPLAFFRGSDRPQYVRGSDGSFSPNGKTFARLSHVALSGESVRVDDDEYLGVAGSTLFVKKSEAVVPEPRAKTPWGTKVGSADRTGLPENGRATWMEASVWGGWLIAYEGNTPVYVTLISPGRGGTPVPGKEPIETASTPTGTFPISGKFATATMEAPGEYIHSDVPWTQNFSGPHALHGAYWHNDWGKLKSAGCVNVSPLDGRWLYEFTEPAVPPGWHGVRWVPSKGPATTFVIHR